MSVKGFTGDTNLFLGVRYRRTLAARACRLVTLFRKMTEIFAGKAKELKKRRREGYKT
jgi:hypothetical protein